MPDPARLLYRTADGQDREVHVNGTGETTIGRHPQCSLTTSMPSVSRRHARLWIEGGAFMVEDLGSSNGTFVNNQRISRSAIRDGDELRCGDFRMSFVAPQSGTREMAPEPEAKPRVVGTLRPRRRPSSEDEAPAGPVGRSPTGPSPVAAPGGRSRPAAAPTAPVGRGGAPAPHPAPEEVLRPAGRLAPRPSIDAAARPTADVRPPTRPAPEPAARQPDAAPRAVGRISKSPRRGAAGPAQEELDQLRREVEVLRSQAEARRLLEGGVQDANALLEAAEARAANYKAELERLTEEHAEADAESLDLRQDLEDRTRRVHELESDLARSSEQVNTLTDRSIRLKEQVQAQQTQLEEYRREKVELETAGVALREQIDALRQAHDASGNRESELADQVNDLKREVRQKEKAFKEVERQLDLAEYNLRAAREENENLRLALGEDDSQRQDLNTTVEHLRQVLAEKEAMIEQLQVEVARWQDRAEQAEQRAREVGGSQVGAAQEQLRTAENERRVLLDRIRAMEADLERARTEAADSRSPARQAVDQINELKRANRELRNELDGLRGATLAADPGEIGRLEDALAEAERARDAAEAARRNAETAASRAPAPAASPDTGRYTALRDAAVATYESLNDIASDMRTNVDLATGYVTELAPLIERVTSLDLARLGDVGNLIAGVVEDTDARFTHESAGETLEQAQAATESFKTAMRRFRELLREHGYGR